MTLRETILAVDDHIVEYVDVPEWGVKVGVKSLTVAEQHQFLNAVRKRGVKEFELDRVKFPIQLLIRTVVDPDSGKLILEQADAEALAGKSGKAVAKLLTVAARLAGLGDDQVDEAIDDLKGMASDA